MCYDSLFRISSDSNSNIFPKMFYSETKLQVCVIYECKKLMYTLRALVQFKAFV